jgi:transketolase
MDLDQLSINTIRTLSMDAVQQASSGHPGTPMAMAPVAYTLWQRHLRFDPNDPIWPNRDRFVLSAGHASMRFSLLHLTGVKAVNPGHETSRAPSASRTSAFPPARQPVPVIPSTGGPRIETTIGPWPGGPRAWDGDRRSGVVSSTVRLRDDARHLARRDGARGGRPRSGATHLQLGNLCWIYDNNHITIEGHTSLAFSDDVATRFIGYGWNVTRVGDANDWRCSTAFGVFKKTPAAPPHHRGQP